MKVKICGLTRPEDIAAVNSARPDYIGFVFAPSRRRVTAEQAKNLRAALHPDILPVGVFVDEDPLYIAGLFRAGTIAMAQLHGVKNEEICRALKSLVDIPVIKAVQAASTQMILEALPTVAEYLLLDHGSGGTGKSFDWQQIPDLDVPYFLAGGLGEPNLAEALALSPKPYCLDISSGVESMGLKDAGKIARVIERIRQAQTGGVSYAG